MEIRTATISFSKNLAKATNCREMEITRRLQALDELICNNFQAPDIDQVLNEFDDLKTELQTIYTKKGNAAIFRSKCRWVEKGERPTKYFFNLERRNYNKKTISEKKKKKKLPWKMTCAVDKFLDENFFSDSCKKHNIFRQTNIFLEVKLRRLRRRTYDDKYDICDKNLPTVLANSSTHSRPRCHDTECK